MQSRKFLGYIHVFRCFAIAMVVLSHLILSLQWKQPEALHLARMLFSNGTVYFIFIAGYLFQYLLPKYQYGSYLAKKIRYVLLPYFLISMPIIVAKLAGWVRDYPAFSEHFGNLSPILKILVYYLTGMHLGPLWFIPMIFLFYLAAPLFILATNWRRSYLLLPLMVVINLGIPRPWVHDPIISSLHFAPIYIIGILACRYREKIYHYSRKGWPLLAGAIALLCYGEYYNPPLMAFNSVTKVIASFLIIYLLQRWEETSAKPIPAWINLGADLSFGIFFVHQYAIGIFSRFLAAVPWGDRFKEANWLSVPGNFIVVIGFCAIVLLCLKTLLGKRSRYVIGC
jgi:peptidoglycan/LPS O-acetylase OafA/YrhL